MPFERGRPVGELFSDDVSLLISLSLSLRGLLSGELALLLTGLGVCERDLGLKNSNGERARFGRLASGLALGEAGMPACLRISASVNISPLSAFTINGLGVLMSTNSKAHFSPSFCGFTSL